jgi:hypothetical protein
MKLNEAEDIIMGKGLRSGYCVSFEVRKGSMLQGDHFPDVHAGESGIRTADQAWDMASRFASAKHKDPVVNVYVISAVDFSPVIWSTSRRFSVRVGLIWKI